MLSVTPCINNEVRRRIPVRRREAVPGEPLILVVEDDPSTRHFICTILKYATTALVFEASDPDVALTMAGALGRPVDLLVSDIDLAVAKTGIDLAREIVVINPSAKVLLISGNDSPLGCISPDWRFLAKPFSIAAFLACVDELCGTVNFAETFFTNARNESVA
jgi:CheY-like chemotaxis protein